jgi:hypothetical protein
MRIASCGLSLTVALMCPLSTVHARVKSREEAEGVKECSTLCLSPMASRAACPPLITLESDLLSVIVFSDFVPPGTRAACNRGEQTEPQGGSDCSWGAAPEAG